MKTRVAVPYILTLIILSLIIIVGAINTVQLYNRYGWRAYTVTTIIEGTETNQTLHVMNNLVALGLLTWITGIVAYALYIFYKLSRTQTFS